MSLTLNTSMSSPFRCGTLAVIAMVACARVASAFDFCDEGAMWASTCKVTQSKNLEVSMALVNLRSTHSCCDEQCLEGSPPTCVLSGEAEVTIAGAQIACSGPNNSSTNVQDLCEIVIRAKSVQLTIGAMIQVSHQQT